jgi:hypothetical protein
VPRKIFNHFNRVNFFNPVGTLPEAIPNNTLTEVNRVQPGQPYIAAAAGTFVSLTSTGELSFLNPAAFATPTASRRGRIFRVHAWRAGIRGRSCAVVRRM